MRSLRFWVLLFLGMMAGARAETADIPVSSLPIPEKGVIVAPFRNETGDNQLNWLSPGLRYAVSSDLSCLAEYEPFLGVISLETSKKLFSATPEELVIFVNEHFPTDELWRGNFRRQGERIAVEIQILDLKTGAVINKITFEERLEALYSETTAMVERIKRDSTLDEKERTCLQRKKAATLQSWKDYSEALIYLMKSADEDIEERNKSYAKAIQILEKVVAREPDFLEAWEELANIYGGLKDGKRLLAAAQRAEGHPDFHMMMARGYAILEKMDQFYSHLRAAVGSGSFTNFCSSITPVFPFYPMVTYLIQASSVEQGVDLTRYCMNSRFSSPKKALLSFIDRIGHPAFLDIALSAVNDPSPEVREEAVSAIGNFDDPRVREAMVARVTDSSPNVRKQVADELGYFDESFALPHLVALLKDTDPKVRKEAVRSLRDLGTDEAGLAIMPAEYDLEEDVREAASRALDKLDRQKIIRYLEEKQNARVEDSREPELKIQLGHTDDIVGFAISDDGAFVVTAAKDGTAIVWESATGREIRRLPGGTIWSFSPDSRSVLTVGAEYDIATGKSRAFEIETTRIYTSPILGERKLPPGILAPTFFSADGRYLVSNMALEKSIHIWQAQTGKLIRSVKRQDGLVYSLAISTDGSYVAVALKETIYVYDVSTGRELRRFDNKHKASVSISFSPDGRQLLFSGFDGNTVLWNVSSGEIIRTFPAALIAFFSKDGTKIYTGQSGEEKINIWNTSTGSKLGELQCDGCGSLSLAGISNNGRFIFAAFGKEAIFWDAESSRLIQAFRGFSPEVDRAALHPAGNYLLLQSRSNKLVHIWNLQAGLEEKRQESESRFEEIGGISPDGKQVASFDSSMARIWDLATGRETKTFAMNEEYPNAVAFSQDGRKLMVLFSSEKKDVVRLFDVETGREIWNHKSYSAVIPAKLGFSPDGRSVIIPAQDKVFGTMSLQIDLTENKQIRSFNGEFLAFSPEGSQWLFKSSRTYLIDTLSGKSIREFPVRASEAVFSKNGQLIGTARENISQVWDVYSGRMLAALRGHTGQIKLIQFLQNDRLLLTVARDGTARIWNWRSQKEVCKILSLRNSWVVVDSEGRFDTGNLEELRELYWILPQDPFKPLPLEIFMRDYYEPRLLQKILSGESLTPVKTLEDLNIAQPRIEITKIETGGESPGKVSVTIDTQSQTVEGVRSGKNVQMVSGVYDLRLFRDGQLVAYAPAEEGSLHQESVSQSITFRNIQIPARFAGHDLTFSTYAFNSDNVRSFIHRKTYKVTQNIQQKKSRAYLINVGVNEFENREWNLQYAVNDALRLQEVILNSLSSDTKYENVVPILLTSEKSNQGATRNQFHAVLKLLAGKQVDPSLFASIKNADKIKPVRPEDVLLITFSSHGYAAVDGTFYLFPSDIGPGNTKHLTEVMLPKLISSKDLSTWLRDIDVGELVLIVDACQSAAAVQTSGFKPGPLGSRGLGQLAYDKGMIVLVASQGDNTALESDLLEHGLLTYALVREGLELLLADFDPKDGVITLQEWLNFGVARVPGLAEDVSSGKVRGVIRNRDSKIHLQQPSLFNFRNRGSDFIVTSSNFSLKEAGTK